MRKRFPTAVQHGLDRGDALAGFDSSGTGHGANNGLAAGRFVLDLGVHGRRVLRAGVSLPNSARLDAAIEANLRELGYGG